MEREVRYCTSEDGVRIAYSVEGDGLALLWMPLFVESIAKESLTPSIVHFLGRLRQENRVVRYDPRGTGLSQREVEDFSTRAQAADIEAVLTAANAGPVVLMSFTAWSILTLSYAASHPKRVNGLVLWNGQATTEDTLPKGIYDVIVQMLRTNWAVGARTLADFGGRASAGSQLKTPGTPWSIGPVDSEHLAEAWLLSATGETVAATMEANRGADVTALLPQIRCPALILQNAGRSMDSAQRLASRIADSRLVPLATNDTAVNSDGLDTALGVITNFLAERAGRSRPRSSQQQSADHALRTVLFTDLVAHTEMLSRLGDERGRDVLREHERITRDVLKAHGGYEVKTMGDRFHGLFRLRDEGDGVRCGVAESIRRTGRRAAVRPRRVERRRAD